MDFLYEESASYQVFPPRKQIFEALNQCPLEKVKVVIIGQGNNNNWRLLCLFPLIHITEYDRHMALHSVYKRVSLSPRALSIFTKAKISNSI